MCNKVSITLPIKLITIPKYLPNSIYIIGMFSLWSLKPGFQICMQQAVRLSKIFLLNQYFEKSYKTHIKKKKSTKIYPVSSRPLGTDYPSPKNQWKKIKTLSEYWAFEYWNHPITGRIGFKKSNSTLPFNFQTRLFLPSLDQFI